MLIVDAHIFMHIYTVSLVCAHSSCMHVQYNHGSCLKTDMKHDMTASCPLVVKHDCHLLQHCAFQVAYFGPAAAVMDYFGTVGLHCSYQVNPADFASR